MNPKTGRGDARCECASACFFIWAAGAIRIGNVVGIHRPSFDRTAFSAMSPSEARANYDWLVEASKSYLTKIGVSQELVNKAFSISSTKISYLGHQELAKLHRSPHLEELLIAKCGVLTSTEEFIAILEKKLDEHPRWREEADHYFNRKKCEIDSLQVIHRQTNREYLKIYEKGAAHTPPQSIVALDSQLEAEAKKVLTRVLKASGIRGYFVQPRKDVPELKHKHVHAIWTMRDEPVVGTLLILGPEREMGVERAATWVAAGKSKGCGDLKGRFVQSPLQPVQGGARMMTACEYEGIRDGGHYTFISRKEGGLYLFATLPAIENGLEAAGSAHDKLSDATIRILGPQTGQ